MAQAITEFFRSFIPNDILVVLIIAFIPIVEVRGAIPIAISMGFSPIEALLYSFFGASLAVPILLLLLKWFLDLLKKWKPIRNLAFSLENVLKDKAKAVEETAIAKGKKKGKDVIENYILLGLYAFVAVPLPLTGVWTGSAIAVFLNQKFWKSLFSVLLGNFTAAAIVTILSIFLSAYIDIIIGVFFLLVALIFGFFITKVVIKAVKMKKTNQLTTDNQVKFNDQHNKDIK